MPVADNPTWKIDSAEKTKVVQDVMKELLETWGFNFERHKPVILAIFRDDWKWSYETPKKIKEFIESVYSQCSWTIDEALDIILPYRDWNHSVRILSQVKYLSLDEMDKIFLHPDMSIKWEEGTTKWLPIVQWELAKRLPALTWIEAENWLRNERMQHSHRCYLAQKCIISTLWEISDFLVDNSNSEEMRTIVFWRVKWTTIQELESFLINNPNTWDKLRGAIWNKIEALKIKEDEKTKIDWIIDEKLKSLDEVDWTIRQQNIDLLNERQRQVRDKIKPSALFHKLILC